MKKRARELVAGDRVTISPPFAHATIASCKPSRGTPIKSRVGGYEGTALIAVFDVVDGPYRGERHADFLHPNDEVEIR